MKTKTYLNLALLALLGVGLAACGAGAGPQEMPSGIWQLNFNKGLMASDCRESGTYQVYIQPESYATNGYYTNGNPPGYYNQLFYGNFTSQIGGGGSNDCFNGIIGATPIQSSIGFCQAPRISQGYTIRFYGCTLSEINYVYYFTASYQISGGGAFVNGTVSGSNGSVQ